MLGGTEGDAKGDDTTRRRDALPRRADTRSGRSEAKEKLGIDASTSTLARMLLGLAGV